LGAALVSGASRRGTKQAGIFAALSASRRGTTGKGMTIALVFSGSRGFFAFFDAMQKCRVRPL